MTPVQQQFLKKAEFPKEGAKYSLVATHMDPNAKTLEKMEKLIQNKGLEKITDGLKIQVTGMKGPCESNFKEKLDKFAENILNP